MELAAKHIVRLMMHFMRRIGDARAPSGVSVMKAKALPFLACGLFLAVQAHAQAPEPEAELALESFFTGEGDDIAMADEARFSEAWQDLEEEEREMLAADCAAALDVGAEVPGEASATGDVADLPEVESVEPEMQNDMESDSAAGDTAGDDPLATLGPQRRALAGEEIPAETWVAFCEAVQDQEG